MEEKENTPFKIRFDDDTTEEAEKREARPSAFPAGKRPDIDGLNRRVTMIAVAIPIVTIVLFVFMYVNINKNVANSTAEGMANYEKLSQDLEKRLSDLSVKSEKLKKSLETETGAFEKRTDLFTKSLNKNAAAIKGLNNQISGLKKTAQSKIGKKELASYSSKIETQVSALKSEIESMSVEHSGFKSEIRRELEMVQDTHRTIFEVLQKLKVDMVSLSESQITQEKLDNALQRQHEKYKHALEVVSEKFENKLSEVGSARTNTQQPDIPQQPPDKSNLSETDLSG